MENNFDFEKYCYDLRSWLAKEQPEVEDLDACQKFLKQLNAVSARHAHVVGQMESVYASKTMQLIKNAEDEEYKRVKNSSTLVERWVNGQIPNIARDYKEINDLGKVLKMVADNYRTLISSYRSQMEMEAHSRVRNQNQSR
jgi:hypothetical protein